MPASNNKPSLSGGVLEEIYANFNLIFVSIVTPHPVLAPLNTAVGFLFSHSTLKSSIWGNALQLCVKYLLSLLAILDQSSPVGIGMSEWSFVVTIDNIGEY